MCFISIYFINMRDDRISYNKENGMLSFDFLLDILKRLLILEVIIFSNFISKEIRVEYRVWIEFEVYKSINLKQNKRQILELD